MVNKSDNNRQLINQEAQHHKSIRKILPDAKLICIKLTKDSLVKKNFENIEDLSNCDFIEIVTHISIDTKNFRKLMIEAGYRIFDITNEHDGFHYFVRILERKDTLEII